MPVSQLLNQKERLGGYFRRHGLEGESAFRALAHHYLLRYAQRAAGVPAGVREKWKIEHDKIKSAEQATHHLDKLILADHEGAALPDWYQYFVGRRFREGSGKFFTPKPIANVMARLLPEAERPVIMDPTAGGGTFLMEAAKVWAHEPCVLVANDVEQTLVELAMLTLSLGTAPEQVKYYLSTNIFDETEDLIKWYGRVDYILANPPFSLRIENEQFDSPLFTHGYRNSDALFIDKAWRLLKPAGRLVCLLPHSLVANNEFAGLRKLVEEMWSVRGVVCLPEGVFLLSAGTTTRADIVVLDKKSTPGEQAHRKVFASVPSVGIKLNNNSKDGGENDLEQVLQDQKVRKTLGLR